MNNRILELDFIKGLCITLMVFGHVTYIGTESSKLEMVKTFIYTFHMPLFLIISGFLFSISITKVKTQIKKIILKTGVPYLIFVNLYLIGLIIAASIGLKTNNPAPYDIKEYLLNVFLKPIGAFWFLHSLIIIQIGIIGINYFFKKNNQFFAFIAMSFFIFLILHYLNLVYIRTYIYFLTGYLISLVSERKIIIPFWCIFPTTFFMILLFKIHPISSSFSAYEFGWNLLVFVFFFIVANRFGKFYPLKWTTWLGQNTLIIMVLHPLFIVGMKSVSNHFLMLDNSGYLYCFVATAVSITLCIYSAILLDKIKLSQLLFNNKEIYIRRNEKG